MHPGDVVDQRFAIERFAAVGGMGAVYRARDLHTGVPVALKVLLNAPLHEAELRFEREALTLAELDHPGIVRHVAHGATMDGSRYLAMEWIDGEDLAARIRRAPLSAAETTALGRRLAESLGAAHSRGVVHRDLKPSNILLPGGILEQATIVDFGVATFPKAPRATLSGTVVGTPAYMAPEQAQGARDLDARSDIFALGCILHECLTGHPVFDGQHFMAILLKIVLEEVPRLCDLGLDVPPALDALIGRMLAKDRALRPADGSAMTTALAELETTTELTSSASASLGHAEMRLACIVLAQAPPEANPSPRSTTSCAQRPPSSPW
jgi:serine/threonine protein kinase